ncbi:MAG: hypothetical protein M3Y77_21775 [Actinomycetota bacterium]|nr:hypothetical protein [Actinomycetota bacterium]
MTFFTALCTGLGGDKPREKFNFLTGELDSKKAAAATLLTEVAGKLDAAVARMKTAGAPSVEDGSKLAAAVISTFGKLSADARAGAASLAGATDAASLQQLFDKALDTMNSASAGLDAFNEMMGAPAMEVQLGKIPSCAKLINA